MIDPLATTIATVTATTVAGAVKGAKGPAQAIDDIMQLVGFGKLNELANKSRAKQELRENEYKVLIAQEIDKIPDEFLQEPKLSIVGPAIEASRYYIEESELREMFAKIVAASVDSRENNRIHQSYVEVVKQLSSTDAKHLQQINSQRINPLIDIKEIFSETKGFRNIVTNLFYSNSIDISDHELISASLVNLQRLGLIEIPNGSSYTADSHYELLINSLFVRELMKQPLSIGIEELKVEKGLLQITSFGRIFCKVCL